MKKTIRPVIAAAAAAVVAIALSGCEWGGVGSDEAWNDAYSWANFSGTYKLVNEIPTGDASSTEGSSSSTTESSTTSTTTTKTNLYSKTQTFAFKEGTSTYSGLTTPIYPGKTSISFAAFTDTFTDNGDGTLNHSGDGSASGSINYASGSVSVSFAGARPDTTMTVKYSYYTVTTTTTGNGSTTTTTTDSLGNASKSKTKKTAPITWLNLTQKGNLLTFKDNDGTTYSGRITGASCPKADEGGYIQAAHIRFPFEATCTSNPRITLSGSISGDWSGGSSATSGTLANRTIDATYHTGSSSAQIMAVSGTATVSPKDISASPGVTY